MTKNEEIILCEQKNLSLSKCFQSHANNCPNEQIMNGGIGFNPNSGYVYLCLQNNIQICSMLGKEVEYIVTNFETGEETFFDSYKDAKIYLETIFPLIQTLKK